MRTLSTLTTAFAVAAITAISAPATGGGFVDVMASPAQSSPLASRSLLQAVTRAGDRLIAVGQRGHIVVSRDAGTTWQQAKVPVSSDLVAVYFVDAARGWAVGHDGVVLNTLDGGETWQLQLDGRKANDLVVAAMERKVAAEPASEDARKLLAEAKRYREQGPDKPFLDVWFADADHGFVVGAYNLIFRTTDGGKTWESWFDRTDNPKFFNLYAIRPAAGTLFIAGEAGLVLTLDPAKQRFGAVRVSYNGSFFGVTAARNAVLIFGLRGNVFRSDDGGGSWTKVETGLPASVVATTRTSRGATLLGDIGGRVIATDDGGRTFRPVALKQSVPLTGMAEAGEGRLALTGPRGVSVTEAAAP